ncbi:hypothetical protein [Isoptericola aurantiacus]|uniref:hypothetical protein n=1 Tax=Isoptericola aurantiacus TaxID=3377839 RepID=UPI00383B6F54
MFNSLPQSLGAASALALAVVGLVSVAPSATAADPATVSYNTNVGTIRAEFSDTTLSAGDAFTVAVTLINYEGPARLSLNLDVPEAGGIPLFVFDGCIDESEAVETCGITAGPDGGVIVAGSPPVDTRATATVELRVNNAAPAGTYPITGLGIAERPGLPNIAGQLGPATPFTVTAPAEADLGVALDATAGPLLGSQITYDLDVSNTGPGDATASSVEIDLPHKVYSVSNLPAACAYDSSTDVVTCDTGAVTNGDTSSLSFKANIALLAIGSLNATATRVSSSPDDPNPANDTSTAHCGSLTGLIITC